MRRLAVLLLGLIVSLPVHAQTVDEVEKAWRGWMTKNGRQNGGLVVLHKGTLVREATMGRLTAGAPVPLASLSKAVTAVCVATLVERGKLSFETPLSRALDQTFARIGPPADTRLDKATIGQLLTHRAGFDRGADPATSTLAAYLRNETARRTAFDARLKSVLRQRLVAQPGERYGYSNSAYQILGAVVEEASGQEYETYCRQTVLLPLGALGAELDPAWRVMSSYGGWRMSLADYGRFYQAFVPGNRAIGDKSRRWMMAPQGKATVGNGTHYGLGTDVRPLPTGDANFWHWGRWAASIVKARDGPLHASYSAFAIRWGGIDVNMVTYMTPDIGDGALRSDLERVLAEATKAVKRWQ